METAARPALVDDLDVVVAMHDAAVAELRPHRGGEMWSRREARTPPYPSSIADSLDDDGSLLAVGTIDGTVVGFAAIREVDLHDATSVGDLTELFVLPDARGVGVGEAMMELATTWARDRGCVGIDSIALPGDRATKNFFETFGLVARALRVHRAF